MQSGVRLHAYGRRAVNHSRDMYGAPNAITFCRARASEYGWLTALTSPNALHLVRDLDRVVVRGVLAPAEDLRRELTAALERDELQLASVELEP